MKIAILVTFGGNFGQRGFYNRQEVGLARGLAELGHEVEVHKATSLDEKPLVEDLGLNCILRDVPCRFFGTHGWFDKRLLEAFQPDAVLMFADIQLAVPSIYRWCKTKKVVFIPYIGTMTSNKQGRKLLEKICRWRNYRVFKAGPVLAKTESVNEELRRDGIVDCRTMRVGFDSSNLHEIRPEDIVQARNVFQNGSKPTIGFVGRMLGYKQPLRLIGILKELRKSADWHLAVVGDGDLSPDFEAALEKENLTAHVTWLKKLPNSEMWQLYAATDVLVNLNSEEIFGMALLEALHYSTPIVAVKAPGPEIILRDGVDGYLVSSDIQDIVQKIHEALDKKESLAKTSRSRVESEFSWTNSARIAEQAILEGLNKSADRSGR